MQERPKLKAVTSDTQARTLALELLQLQNIMIPTYQQEQQQITQHRGKTMTSGQFNNPVTSTNKALDLLHETVIARAPTSHLKTNPVDMAKT